MSTPVANTPVACEAGQAAPSPRILVAEDNPVNRSLIKQQLASLGYRDADLTEDGMAAWELWRSREYRLVLTDLDMPVLDGYQLTARIREAESGTGRHTPVIAVTAHVGPGAEQRCLEAGLDQFLAKPVELRDLKLCLGRWLGLRDSYTKEAPP